jgi:putative intracellular protease/amidase
MEDQHPFELYTVSDSTKPIHASDGMQIVPDYSFDNAPKPDVVVIPAQSGRSSKMLDWVRRMTSESDVVMSVCTGAFVLADAGLLNGKHATTHHDALADLKKNFPEISVERGMRFVQSDRVIFTAGGLSSGIDLALHIVELYFGREAAQATADMMEYEGTGWKGNGQALTRFSPPMPPTYPSDLPAKGMLGRWEGVIHTSDGDYRVALHLWRRKTGALGGALDSVDQEAYGLALGNVSVQGNTLSFTVPAIMGSYEGTVDPSSIRGRWKQHGLGLRLDLERRSSVRPVGLSNDIGTHVGFF